MDRPPSGCALRIGIRDRTPAAVTNKKQGRAPTMRALCSPALRHLEIIPGREHIPRVEGAIRRGQENSKKEMAMMKTQQSEPPSRRRPPLFMVGQDGRGN